MPSLLVRSPGLDLDRGPIVWSRIPEFSYAYTGASVIIPYVEHYLNAIMNKVRADHCAGNPDLKETLTAFIRQETQHAQFHHRFNARVFAAIPELQRVADGIVADLKRQREERSLAFNAAYCVGFESIATFDCKYLHEECDDLFEGADPQAANLLLWHVAEEFEHRAVCHDAFEAVSGSHLLRTRATLYAFRHLWGEFMRAESIILEHFARQMTPREARESRRRSKQLMRRHLRYLLPRLLQIFSPTYHPARIPVPPRIAHALLFFSADGPIDTLLPPPAVS